MTAPDPEVVLARFVRDGRIIQYPAKPAVRALLLAHVARQSFDPGDELTESEVNDRLRPWHDDVAVLRRYLVDHGLLERTRSGSSYALPRPETQG